MDQPQNSSPIFICGFPKSGTTLLLALLDHHPELLAFPEETRFFKDIVGKSSRCNPDYVLSQSSVKKLGLGKFTMTSGQRDYSNIDFDEYEKHLRYSWDQRAQDERALLECIIGSYGHVTEQRGKKYWVEKTPLNEKYLKKAVTLWPNMRAIYIIRDPRDNYCSYKKQRDRRFLNRSNRIMATQDLSPDEKKAQIKKISPPLSLNEFIAYWLESFTAWERFRRQHVQCLQVIYSNLVRSPESELLRICEFLGIDWDPILLKPTHNGMLWSGNSVHGERFSGISLSSLGRYKGLVENDEIRYLDSWLHPLINLNGWQIESNLISPFVLLKNLILAVDTKPFIKYKILIEQLNLRILL
jgi:hypothetical protein